MVTHRVPRQIDETTAERLLDGEPVAGHEPLARLIAAASAPGRDEELIGEAEALAAFRLARHAAPASTGASRLKGRLARSVVIKAAVLVVAAGGVGGVAFAASGGHLPDPDGRRQPRHAVAEPDTPPPPDSDPPPRERVPPTAGTDPGKVERIRVLCNRYFAKDIDHRRSALEHEPDFRDLINYAGGRDQGTVDRFCDGVRAPASHPNWPMNGAPSPRPDGSLTWRPNPAPTRRQTQPHPTPAKPFTKHHGSSSAEGSAGDSPAR